MHKFLLSRAITKLSRKTLTEYWRDFTRRQMGDSLQLPVSSFSTFYEDFKGRRRSL